MSYDTGLAAPSRLPRHGGLTERQYDSDRNLMANADDTAGGYGSGLDPSVAAEKSHSNPKRKRNMILLGVAIVLAIAIAVGVGVGVSQSKNGKNDSANAGKSAETSLDAGGDVASTAPPANPSTPVTNTTAPVRGGSGKSGSLVTTDLNVTFTYVNDFGGSWAYDPDSPFNVSGQAQSWSPAITEEWVWGKDIVHGVNLGGWLVTEPFIVPGLYEEFPTAVDEYTLSQAMGANLAKRMDEHYKTFIAKKDFADIAAAGLNWVRIPIGYWAIETTADEPYLPKVSWSYFTKAISWARKYGIRILLDFHSLPGSQNGWNHSGKSGKVNWMYGAMGIANAQRTLEYLRSMVQYISQPGIKEVVPMIGLVNEVQASIVGKEVMGAFYYQALKMIREIAGTGAGNGPIIAIHEGFIGVKQWDSFLPGADRLALDQHPYLAFGGVNQNPWSQQTTQACSWGGGTNDTQKAFGIVIGGEWSLATNDCGMWLSGVNVKGGYENAFGSCAQFEDWRTWDDTFKAGALGLAQGSMDALQNWFFWTWRIGNSTVRGYPPSPMWHYQLGLEQGYIPKDPRSAGGYCKRNGMCPGCYEFDGVFPTSATGGSNAVQAGQYAVFPPPNMSPAFVAANTAVLPTLTQTGTPITLPVPAESAKWLTGWANSNDKVGAWVPVAGCPYPDAYNADEAGAMPNAICGANGVGASVAPVVPLPVATPAAEPTGAAVVPPPAEDSASGVGPTGVAPPAASLAAGVTAAPVVSDGVVARRRL